MQRHSPDQVEAIQAMSVYRQATAMALTQANPQDVAAATAAILQAAFIMATADLSAERRAALFREEE